MSSKFSSWFKNHPCSRETLWYIQNCLGSIVGFDHPEAKAAQEAWHVFAEFKSTLEKRFHELEREDREEARKKMATGGIVTDEIPVRVDHPNCIMRYRPIPVPERDYYTKEECREAVRAMLSDFEKDFYTKKQMRPYLDWICDTVGRDLKDLIAFVQGTVESHREEDHVWKGRMEIRVTKLEAMLKAVRESNDELRKRLIECEMRQAKRKR